MWHISDGVWVCDILYVFLCVSEGDKASVFRTTKVRTKLKGDGSWLQRRSETEEEEEEVKPW